MANRHLARSVVLQALYEWDFLGKPEKRVKDIAGRAIGEFAPGMEGEPFIWRLIEGVTETYPKLDRVIEQAAPEWPIEQISVIDRNILRLGLWELLFGSKEEVPPKVAINEAIELAKTFGSRSSGRFVNGVLGTVYRELDEPSDGSTEKREALAGAIVFRKENGATYLAMVKDIFGYWTFVKGHRGVGESAEAAALREAKEEIGITGTVMAPIGAMSYVVREGDQRVKRTVEYYLVETGDETLTLEQSSGLKEARWIKPEEFKTIKHYENQEEIVEKAMACLKPKTKD